MPTTQQKRDWWDDWRCNPLKMVSVTFPGSDRDWNLLVADAAAPAFELFADLMRKHNYLFREVSGGTYNCRYIGGTISWSLHAYGIAIDLNPSKNPYGTTTHNFPQAFIEEVLATGLFRWGMSFRDPMHWEIDVPPSQIGDDMPLTDADVDKVANRVVKLLETRPTIPDQDDGVGRRGWTHGVKQAWGYSIKAATDAGIARRLVEKLSVDSSVSITQADREAIAEEVANELRQRLVE